MVDGYNMLSFKFGGEKFSKYFGSTDQKKTKNVNDLMTEKLYRKNHFSPFPLYVYVQCTRI